MKYCPKCQTLSEPADPPACVACGTVLLSTDEMSREDLDRTAVLTYCDSPEEASVLKAALEGEGVHAMVEDEALMGLFPPYGDPLNLGPRVVVRLGDADAALDFLRRKQAGDLTVTDSDVEAAEAEELPADESRGEAEDAHSCPTCGAPLVPLAELSEEEQDQIVVLKWCENIEEAQVLRAALSGMGIDSVVEDETIISTGTNAYNGKGGATDTRVLVNRRDAEAALDFLRSKEAGELAITDEDVSAEQEGDPTDGPKV
jgi:hypothetical protein